MASRRLEIVPLPIRLIRAPVASRDLGLIPSNGHDGSGAREVHSRAPGVAPSVGDVILLCGAAARIDFYVDPDPNSQLLMALFLAAAYTAGIHHRRLSLVHGPLRWGHIDAETAPGEVAPPVPVAEEHLAAAAAVWSTYCAPNPEAWLALTDQNVRLFPFMKDTVEALLDDLPRRDTGLGSCERLALSSLNTEGSPVMEVVAAFYREPARLIDLPQIVALLSSLASGSTPLIDGLEGRLGADDFCVDAQAWDRFRASRVRLTDAGLKVRAGELDLVEAHGINRWWGGTRLTRQNCWRWDHRTGTLTPPTKG